MGVVYSRNPVLGVNAVPNLAFIVVMPGIGQADTPEGRMEGVNAHSKTGYGYLIEGQQNRSCYGSACFFVESLTHLSPSQLASHIAVVELLMGRCFCFQMGVNSLQLF